MLGGSLCTLASRKQAKGEAQAAPAQARGGSIHLPRDETLLSASVSFISGLCPSMPVPSIFKQRGNSQVCVRPLKRNSYSALSVRSPRCILRLHAFPTLHDSGVQVLLTAFAAASVSVGSCVLNDWFDIELDRVNEVRTENARRGRAHGLEINARTCRSIVFWLTRTLATSPEGGGRVRVICQRPRRRHVPSAHLCQASRTTRQNRLV